MTLSKKNFKYVRLDTEQNHRKGSVSYTTEVMNS
jgi:hypothetical protein